MISRRSESRRSPRTVYTDLPPENIQTSARTWAGSIREIAMTTAPVARVSKRRNSPTVCLHFACALRRNAGKKRAPVSRMELIERAPANGTESNSHARLGPGTRGIIPEIARNAGSSRVPGDRKREYVAGRDLDP